MKPRINRDLTAITDYLMDRGFEGATCDQIETALSMSHQTASARCSELLKSGIVVRKMISGHWVRMPTRTGSLASVMILDKFSQRQRGGFVTSTQ